MKVLVTGGAGFIGSHIAEELIRQNYEVVVVDNLVTGKKENIPNEAPFYFADVRGDIDEVFAKEKPHIVIHQAAQVSVSYSMTHPGYDAEENIRGTINVMEMCVKYNVQKFIFASSAAVYGTPEYLSIDENHPVSPISFYGLSKQNAEKYIQMFSDAFGLNYTILRYSNVYGIRQDTKGEAGVVALFIEKAIKGEDIKVFGDGKQTRDFIFVKDVAAANAAACMMGNREIINISHYSSTSVMNIIEQLSLISGERLPYSLHPERPGDIRDSILSNSKASQVLKWAPSYNFSQGLKETMNDYQKDMMQVL
ncbi:NAD-dependent epimerase/dehydratase family protein [Halobacillus sp. ACCC02827]|uniref:NAD-dependent epimerase/dehydratase family protein n=1 Tax=Halobacillus sp. ACCC02827 TaxID=3052090 RepID=UPI00257117A7|nr:NAD-dependent epimerase/dehydratase family protein [Halobacillus sp. ACCC02827]WJE15009.1 NAD-dependent epimerase/dehydratase family protein [Halobacillus sp. ACCC02827]